MQRNKQVVGLFHLDFSLNGLNEIGVFIHIGCTQFDEQAGIFLTFRVGRLELLVYIGQFLIHQVQRFLAFAQSLCLFVSEPDSGQKADCQEDYDEGNHRHTTEGLPFRFLITKCHIGELFGNFGQS